MSFIPHTPAQRTAMLARCGVASIEDLFRDIPSEVRAAPLPLGPPRSEYDLLRDFRERADRNRTRLALFLGGGFYDHYVPAAVDALASRSEFYTAYTPYQPEVSQGTLQAMYEYQSHICRLTGMEVSNASVYDGGNAVFEACRMALGAVRGRRRIVIADSLNPLYRDILRTGSANLDIDRVEVATNPGGDGCEALAAALDDSTAGVIVQNPDFFGSVHDYSALAARCHEKGARLIQCVYPMALAMIAPPGEQGADIAVGEGQSLGNPLGFGGPYFGFMATTGRLTRKLPGRLAGRTLDRNGREAFVLTIQAREQHIRREKATSNICTNQALCALRANLYLSLVGRAGFSAVARACYDKAEYAKRVFSAIPGVRVLNTAPTFNEFVLALPVDAARCAGAMMAEGVVPGLPLGAFYPALTRGLLVALTEKRTRAEIDRAASLMRRTLESFGE